MVDSDPTRRQISVGLGTALGITLAGCMSGDDDDGNGDDGGNDDGNGDGGNGDDGNGDDGNGDDSGNGEEAPDPEGSALLGFRLEDEEGEEVTIGMDFTIEHADYADQSVSRSYVGDWDEVLFYGDETTNEVAAEEEWAPDRLPAHPVQIYYTGDWVVTIEPNEANDFESVEETIEITQDDLDDTPSEEIIREETFVLEGATSDAERAREEAVSLDGRYRIDANHDPDTEWAWGVRDASEAPGAHVEQQEWEEADHQRWDFEPVDEDGKWHRIVAAHTDEEMVWEVNQETEQNEDLESWTTVHIEAWEGTEEQRWRITPLSEDHTNVEEGDELYKIENESNGATVYLDIEGGNFGQETNEPGLPVVTYWYGTDPDQQLSLHEQ